MKTQGIKVAIAIAATASVALVGCSNSQKDSDKKVETAVSTAVSSGASSSATASSSADPANAATAVTLTDGFIKAKPMDTAMTAVFGVLTNNTDQDMTLVGFATDLDSGRYEIHEVVDGTMQPKQGGIVIPAHGTYELKPGADHLMILDNNEDINAGDDVDVQLVFDGADPVWIKDVPVRTIASGEENYGGDGQLQGETGMSEVPAPGNEEQHDHDHGHNH